MAEPSLTDERCAEIAREAATHELALGRKPRVIVQREREPGAPQWSEDEDGLPIFLAAPADYHALLLWAHRAHRFAL